ncbi:Glycosyltransferase involved in cell wall bisynthesis [Microbacterium sp. cf046]|uniref:glycosyltransferase n=1 Tax=Microbacterium sp. cf046 TaxID=1761803 RepID=UPI0008F148F1|nr:glycosyltransferase [Microbacterium sp. cf046]SFR94873.1 Glycosyltransferase involved in cell wall bisynthesis [Microbacterium sp. cf046]
MNVKSHAEFPDAEYVVLSSRLIPDRDGGYALATLARARQMAAAGVHGGLGPLLLTLDPGTPAEHAQHRAAFAGRDLVVDPHRMRNLFDEAGGSHGGAAGWLRTAAHPGEPDPALEYRMIEDAAGRPMVGLPIIAGDPDWHVTTAPIAVYDERHAVAGVVDGFGALYRAWLEHVVDGLRAGDADRPVVVVCESRQLGELLAGWDDPALRLVHAIHTIHLEPPFTPDASLNPLWSRWFTLAERFDAVLWPTAAQRSDVQDRFGASPVHVVVPNAVPAAASVTPLAARVPGRVVMLNRLAPGKRIDHAIRAFAAVIEVVPEATLDVFGDGSEHDPLQRLIDELGLDAHVVLRGLTDDPGRELDAASVFLSTSAFEGQGLSIAEALAHGCPVVAYDVRYGPGDLLAAGGGLLVPDGDIDALSAAMVELLTDIELRARLTAEAVAAARAVHPEHAMDALAQAVADVLARPSRRTT